MRRLAVVVLLAGCGRLGFDARTAGDAGTHGDGAADAAPDAPALPLTQTVSATLGDTDDEFGYAVAVSRDGTTIAIGAPQEDSQSSDPTDNTLTDSGAVYVFVRSGQTWQQQAYIKPTAPVLEEQLGFAVALSADGNTLAAGAPEVPLGNTAGSVYIFTRSGTTWTQQAALLPTVSDKADMFGGAVALDDSGNALVAGAIGEDSAATGVGGNAGDNSASGAGAAYIFTRSGTTWSQQAYLKASNTDAGDQFGAFVAIAGDASRVFVAATGEASLNALDPTDNSGPSAGAVYAFDNQGGWAQRLYIKEPTPDSGAFYGYALVADGTGAHIAAAAPGNDSVVANSGAVYPITIAATTYATDQQLKANNAASNDQLGDSIAITPAGDAILAGEVLQDGNGLDSGAMFSFVRGATSWSQTQFLGAAMPAAGSHFGAAVGMDGNGDTFAVGQPNVGAGFVDVHYFGQ